MMTVPASPRFSIVTPSFRTGNWLKLCIASVADQAGVAFEHIVQDAGSDDGTLEWLAADKRVQAYVEKDQGMYDAVNRGYRRARGEFLAYLNCDEQYLPDALRQVSDFFDRRPDLDVVLADCIIVDDRGRYVCERRALTPRLWHTLVAGNLSFLSAGTFLRRRVVDQHGLWFDGRWRDLGDGEWALRLVKAGLRTAVLPSFTSVFTLTGKNMNIGPNALRERREFLALAPRWMLRARPLILAHHRLRRLFAGHYRGRPHDYAIYTRDSPGQRKLFHVAHPTFRWRWTTS